MRVPGVGKPESRVIVDPATGREFVEREPGVIVTDARGLNGDSVRRETVVSAPGVSASGISAPGISAKDERRAYEAGRVDERSTRRRGPGLLGLIVAILAIIGLVWMYLSWREGSLSGGAAVVDRQITAVGDQTKAAADKARSETGQAVENAGQALKNQGEKIKP